MARLPALAREDFTSTTWKRLEQTLQDRLADLRAINDVAAPELTTAANRGRISEIKRILALAEQASAKQGVNPNDLLDGLPG